MCLAFACSVVNLIAVVQLPSLEAVENIMCTYGTLYAVLKQGLH